MSDHRKNLGNSGEQKAIEYLENNGFSIVERNFRVQSGEIDLIAEMDGVLYFIEVKTRLKGDFLEGYSRSQHKRLWRTAERYIAKNKIESQVGFGILGIIGNPDSENCHIELITDHHEP